MRGLAIVAAVLVATPVAGQDVERIRGDDVAVYNLAGTVEVVRGSGSEVVVRIERRGADASELRIETGGQQCCSRQIPNDMPARKNSTSVRSAGSVSSTSILRMELGDV